jgi:phospholipase/carboxylesterase
MTDLSFTHRYIPATQAGLLPLLLLHGTGGNENDLVPLGEQLLPGAALLSPRGKVLENGLPRFFRRLAEGVFDQADLKARTTELAEFIATARKSHDLAAPIAVGLSNGANIAISLLLTQPGALAGAVLLRGMLPFALQVLPDLKLTQVLLLFGRFDPLVPPASRERLVATLTKTGAFVTSDLVEAGHSLSQQDLTIAAQWLRELKLEQDT